MTDTDAVRQLFCSSFHESPEWVDCFFTHAYREENALVRYVDSQPASCLLLEPYSFKIGNATVSMSYLSCAATAPRFRSHGLMSRLITDALHRASGCGSAFVALIPASERLYFFYDRFGFSTVFYTRPQRYTSQHCFTTDDSYIQASPTFEAFNALETQRACTVIHSCRNFDNIVADTRLSGGQIISLSAISDGTPAAMLFANIASTHITVRELLSVSQQAQQSALACLRGVAGHKPIVVDTAPCGDSTIGLHSRGMIRITDALTLFRAIASQSPDTNQIIRLHDPLIESNNGVFAISGGDATLIKHATSHVSLDISIDTLAKILFNSPRVGSIFGMPSFRPVMPLMLD